MVLVLKKSNLIYPLHVFDKKNGNSIICWTAHGLDIQTLLVRNYNVLDSYVKVQLVGDNRLSKVRVVNFSQYTHRLI